MNRLTSRVARLAGLALVAFASQAQAQNSFLMWINSNFDEVILLNPSATELDPVQLIADANDINTYDFSTPIEAIQVGEEIWVSDQISDRIARFTATLPTPTWIATISGGMDNIRGLAQVGNRVYVSNSGTSNGAPGAAIVVFEADGTPAGSFVVTNPLTNAPVDPFDVEPFNGRLLLSDIDGDDLVVCDVDGSNAAVLFDGNTNVLEFPQQITVANTGANGEQEIWVNAFSSPAGVHRFSSTGTLITYFPGLTTGGRGVWPLPPEASGAQPVLYSDGQTVVGGLRRFDAAVGTPETIIFTTGGRYISSVTFAPSIICNDIDVNNDGSSFDPTDIDAFLSVFGEGPCIPETATCDGIDFNNDGSLFDPCDIDSFLLVFAEGPCTACGS
jgi:hypothetical protein